MQIEKKHNCFEHSPLSRDFEHRLCQCHSVPVSFKVYVLQYQDLVYFQEPILIFCSIMKCHMDSMLRCTNRYEIQSVNHFEKDNLPLQIEKAQGLPDNFVFACSLGRVLDLNLHTSVGPQMFFTQLQNFPLKQQSTLEKISEKYSLKQKKLDLSSNTI